MSDLIKFSAALFPVFDDFQKNPRKTLKILSEMGFKGVELYGDFIHPAPLLREICQDYQLTITGAQVSWRHLNSQHLAGVMNYYQALGNPHLIIAALGGPWESGHKVTENTIATWLSHAERINQLAQSLTEKGFTLDYHTHDYDFGDKIEGKQSSFELLCEQTNPQVGIEIDTGSCIKGGKIPQHLIAELGERARFVHCKPVTEKGSFETNIGASDDANDWTEIISASQKSAVEWLVVEPENESTDWRISMKNGLKYLQKIQEKNN